ncbi:hypothetical protein FQR65_LT17271 [Abscondita terminalis]|nr:hypothetical protein FQR65_LT17271 [Abscondita terminalis]
MIRELIKLYESHSNLWDCSLDQYKNRNIRKSSIEAISNAMGIPAEEVNDKIHSLRCQFQSINRKKKQNKSGQSVGDNFIVKWEFYEALKFIDLPTTCTNETAIDSLINEDNRTYKDLSPDRGSNHSNYRKATRRDSTSTDISRCNSPVPSTSRAFTPSSSTSQDTRQTPSRLQNVDLSQSQMSVTESTAIFGDNNSLQSVNSRLQTSSVNNPPSTSPEGVPIDDENDDTNIMNYYEKCGSTFFNL